MAYRAVTETKKQRSSDLHEKLVSNFIAAVDKDDLLFPYPNNREEMKRAQGVNSVLTTKQRENMWKKALDYKKQVRIWNSVAPKASEVPSGRTDVTAWRNAELRKRLFIDKFPQKTKDDLPSFWQPSIIWPAYEDLSLVEDIKFCAIPLDSSDDDTNRVRQITKSRRDQRIDERRAKKIAKRIASASTAAAEEQRRKTVEKIVQEKKRANEEKKRANDHLITNNLLTGSLALLDKIQAGVLVASETQLAKLKEIATEGSIGALLQMRDASQEIRKAKDATDLDNKSGTSSVSDSLEGMDVSLATSTTADDVVVIDEEIPAAPAASTSGEDDVIVHSDFV